jgi:hypothetical protein
MAGDRSDDDLVKLHDTPAIWLVRGASVPILAKADNLQMALVKAFEQPRTRVVRTITKMPKNEIVIHPEQINRLWKLLGIGDRTALTRLHRDLRLMDNDKPPDLVGLHSRLDEIQLSHAMRRALAQSGTRLETVADLLRVGAFEFARSDRVGLVVFQQAVDLLRRCGLSWSPDARLDETRARVLRVGAKKRPT